MVAPRGLEPKPHRSGRRVSWTVADAARGPPNIERRGMNATTQRRETAEREHAPCAWCNGAMHRHPKESINSFVERKCCSVKCGNSLAWTVRRRLQKQTVASPSAAASLVAPKKDDEPTAAAFYVAQWLAVNGVTKCPTAAVAPTQASITAADRAGLADYMQNQDVRRKVKLRRWNFAYGAWK